MKQAFRDDLENKTSLIPFSLNINKTICDDQNLFIFIQIIHTLKKLICILNISITS